MSWESNDLVVTWFEIQMTLVVNWFGIQVIWMSIDSGFKWFGCQMIWDSNDLVVNRCVIQMILVVSWFEIQLIWLSNDLGFKWFGCLLVWDSIKSEISFSARLPSKMKRWSSKKAFVRDVLQKWSFETQKRSFCARLPSKMKLWNSKTKLFCETSFKNEALKLKNEAFLRDVLQN